MREGERRERDKPLLYFKKNWFDCWAGFISQRPCFLYLFVIQFVLQWALWAAESTFRTFNSGRPLTKSIGRNNDSFMKQAFTPCFWKDRRQSSSRLLSSSLNVVSFKLGRMTTPFRCTRVQANTQTYEQIHKVSHRPLRTHIKHTQSLMFNGCLRKAPCQANTRRLGLLLKLLYKWSAHSWIIPLSCDTNFYSCNCKSEVWMHLKNNLHHFSKNCIAC